jgi:hypothetical protein
MKKVPENKDAADSHRELVGWEYNGESYIPGVPARDVTLDEVRKLEEQTGEDIRGLLDGSDMYTRKWRLVKEKPAVKAEEGDEDGRS